MNVTRRGHQNGFVLITVVVILAVLAALALMASASTSLDNALVARYADRATLDGLAESGLVHAKWQLSQNNSCAGYMDLPSTAFGDHSYSASITPTAGSPVSIVATGALADGTVRTLSRNDVKVYQAPTTVTLQPGSAGIDTYLWDGAHSGDNFGAASVISINNESAERTALIKFDLSGLPSGVAISSATLELWLQDSNDVDNGVVDAHRVSRSWIEGDFDDQTPPAGGGATYETYDGQFNWTSAGGDYDSNIVASATIPSQIPGWYSWDITDSARAWHAGTVVNDGLLLRASGGIVDMIQFSSSDNASVANRPKLTITYACECGAVCTPPTALSCDADFIPTTKLSQFAPSAIGSDFIRGMTYLPETLVFNSSAVPAGGQWLVVDSEEELFLVANDGTVTTSCVVAGGPTLWTDGVAYIPSGQRANSIAVVYNGTSANSVGFVDLNCNAIGSFSTDSFGAAIPSGIGHIGVTASSTYDDYLAVADGGNSPTVHIVDQNGIEAFALDVGTIVSELHGVAHIPGTDKLLLVDAPTSKVQVIDFVNFSGSSLAEYSSNNFGVSEPEGIAINSATCDHAVGAQISDSVAILNQATGLVAHWKLDETEGLVAVDTDGGHNGELLDGPIWTLGGKIGGALSFDGIDDYVRVPHDDTLSLTSAFTVSAWVRNDSLANSYRIISKETAGANDNFWLGFLGQAWWFGVGGSFFSPPVSFDPGSWYHLAASFDDAANRVVMYVDGVEVLSQATSTSITPNTDPLLIGRNWEGFKFWDGLLDDVRIYNRALDADEVLGVSGVVSGGGPACAADFVADTKESEFSTSSLGISDPWGITYLPPGSVFDGVTTTADGAWLLLDGSNRTLTMTGMDGAQLARTTISLGEPRGVAYLSSGTWDNHLALANPADKRVYFLDMNGVTRGSVSTASFSEHPVGVTAIENSASGTYDGHLAISSDKDGGGGSNAGVYIVDQSGVLQASIDISGFATEPWGIAHVPGKDKFLVVDKSGTLFIIGFDGQLLDQYDTAGFGATQPQSIAINSLTSSHLVLDKDTNRSISLTSSACAASACAANVADNFDSGDYAGSTGTVAWTTMWEEFNDTGGAASGDELVQTDSSRVVLRVRDNDGGGEGVEREADLSGYNGASLSFAYRREGLDNSSDYVAVEVSGNGGGSWIELDRITGAGTDANYQSTSFNISAYISSNTRIRFITSSTLGATDTVYFDDVNICLTN